MGIPIVTLSMTGLGLMIVMLMALLAGMPLRWVTLFFGAASVAVDVAFFLGGHWIVGLVMIPVGAFITVASLLMMREHAKELAPDRMAHIAKRDDGAVCRM